MGHVINLDESEISKKTAGRVRSKELTRIKRSSQFNSILMVV